MVLQSSYRIMIINTIYYLKSGIVIFWTPDTIILDAIIYSYSTTNHYIYLYSFYRNKSAKFKL